MLPLSCHSRPVAPSPTAASAPGSLAQASRSDPSASGVTVQLMRGCVKSACAASHLDLAATAAPAVLIAQWLIQVLTWVSLPPLLSSVANVFVNPSFAWATIRHLTLQTRALGTALAWSEAVIRAAMSTLLSHLQCLALAHSPVALVSACLGQVYVSSLLDSAFACH